ncbi:MAG: hypothetical protein KDD83_09010 [Caldilineaceae bacterium]|nr:hypothetical protein [Caldilineaceae bacterium]
MAFGDYAAWLDNRNILRPPDLDSLRAMDESARALWAFSVARYVVPPDVLSVEYAAVEPMAARFGFDFFGLMQYVEVGVPPSRLTVLTHTAEQSLIAQALTEAGYASESLGDDAILYRLYDDYEVDLDAPSMYGQLGELNRIVLNERTILIGRSTDIVMNALVSDREGASLLDVPEFRDILRTMAAPEMGEVGVLVGIIFQDEVVLADHYSVDEEGVQPLDAVEAQGEQFLEQQPLPPYLLTGFATYQTPDATYLALHVVFSGEEDARHGEEILVQRMEEYISVTTGMPLPWIYERSFTDGSTAVMVMRVDEAADFPVDISWYELLVTRNKLFLLVP